MRPMTEGAVSYDNYSAAKHGWHDPHGQMEATRLNDPSQGRSWAWTMRKARNHIGYGDDGVVNWGDVQGTAVSGDNPNWFVGTRTVAGPFSTKSVPVRRCPWVNIDGKQMRVQAKSFTQGDHLDTVETLHDTHHVPKKPKKPAAANPMEGINRAKMSSLVHGGCQTKPEHMFMSRHVCKEGRTQRF